MILPSPVCSDDLLLVVDVQNDFCPGGALSVPDGNSVVPVVNRMTRMFPHVGFTQDWHPPGHVSFASSHGGKVPFQTIRLPYCDQVLWPDHCVPGTTGAELHPDLDITRAEVIVRKGFNPSIDSYSAFYENDRMTSTGLAGYLRDRGIRRLFLSGLATDFCVQWTALDARRERFEVVVIADAVRGIGLGDSLREAWTAMTGAGVLRINERALAC